jgi:outer membrane murein-binding lipoprotein Lpp
MHVWNNYIYGGGYMRKQIIILTILVMTGCSSKDVETSYNKLQTDYDELESNFNNLQTDYNSLKEENASLQSLIDETTKWYDANYEGNDEIVSAWGKTTFGDNISCSNLNETITQVIVNLTDISEDSIGDFYNSLEKGIENLITATSVSGIESIYIKAVYNGTPVIEYYFGTNGDIQVMYNDKYIDIIQNSIQ